jgi:hypothetical protein
MRRPLLLAALLVGSFTIAAPEATSTIIRRESIGPLTLEVRMTRPVIQPNQWIEVELRLHNTSSTQTLVVRDWGEITFSDHSRFEFPQSGLRMDPGSVGLLGKTLTSSGSWPVGEGRALFGARILEVHEGGLVTIPGEAVGCWNADHFLIQ